MNAINRLEPAAVLDAPIVAGTSTTQDVVTQDPQ